MGLLMALCAGRDGNLSSRHRHMTCHFALLCQRLGQTARRVISRAQLPRLLASVNQPLLAQLVQQAYGLTLADTCTDWLSGDGKELRGSIAKGQQRGEVCFSLISQLQTGVVAQTHYTGTKQSERPVIVNLLADKGLLNSKVVLDALHFTPQLLGGYP